ncbi:MAG TPA: DUF885 domain-containing protein [Candidatus Angelobacter sp.]|nr:DUF885 domain-containing protein [Candidatus Angelobacter sp.]
MTDPALDRLAADYWEAWLRRHPTFATAIGERRFDDRLEDHSAEANARWRAELEELGNRLGAVDPGDGITHAALRESIGSDHAFLDADLDAFSVDPMDGPITHLLNIPNYQSVRTDAEAAALVARWRDMPRFLDAVGDDLRRGAAEGRFAVAPLVEKVLQQIDEVLEQPDTEWSLAAPRDAWPAIGEELLRVIGDEIRPAIERYRAMLADEILPRARPAERPGLMHVPGGAEAYEHLARAHTSLDLRPEDVHRIGLEEIERIDGEFIDLGARLLDSGGLDDTLQALRDDPALHFASAAEVFDTAARSLERANAKVPGWFGRLPQAPCEVVRMPSHEEKHSTIAYYREPSADGSRPGQYYVNTFAPETRPRYEAETLAFHEAVPGHHLQLAIMQELDHLPDFRRFNGSTAFIEGWGLYTERLSEEMGLLSGEMDRFGVLSFDAWRASRLVVDTGIHALGWTRQQAIDFMTDHTALGLNNIANEVDRYTAWPGQALAYKLGQLEILRLRDEARARQGDRFDISRFHDAVLGEGALPLPVLRRVVERELA